MLPLKLHSVRLTLGLLVALTFFGCVGAPQRRLPRRKPTASPTDTLPMRRNDRLGGNSPPKRIPDLRIPEAPKPLPPAPPPRLPTLDQTKSTLPSPPKWNGKPPTPLVPTSLTTAAPAGSDNGKIIPAVNKEYDANNPKQTLQDVTQSVIKRFSEVDSYIARLVRREWLKGKLQPEEIILFKFRKKPWSVYFKWLSQSGQGREVVYVEGQHDNNMHVKISPSDATFLMPAGKVLSIKPDSILVRGNSRHDIREAGIGKMIHRLKKVVQAMNSGDRSQGVAVYHGKKTRSEFPVPLDCIEWKIPPGYEKLLSKGGKRWYYIDPRHQLPTLMITEDEKGKVVEYYRYDRLQFPVKLDENDFDPTRLKKQ